jgi:SAM-dependent methyltransferase
VPQNIYDDADFYKGYSQLPRSVSGLDAAPEWESVKALLPSLVGARILDLGCGFGAFGRWAVENGASTVLGVDLSEKMLSRARELTDTDAIEYRTGDIGKLEISEVDFDLVYSALAFHYIEDFHRLCGVVRSKLRKGGRLVATVEHPIYTAPSNDRWRMTEGGASIWPLDGYFDEGLRERSWLADRVVKYHRTVGTHINALLDNSFRLSAFEEWCPSAEQIAEHTEWKLERERPMFLIFAAEAV